jgi:hypothetical protein
MKSILFVHFVRKAEINTLAADLIGAPKWRLLTGYLVAGLSFRPVQYQKGKKKFL